MGRRRRLPPACSRARRSLMDYETTQDERLLALLAYLLSIPTWLVAPLVIYLVKKDQSRFVAFHAMQCVFLHLSWMIVGAAAGVLATIFGHLGPLVLFNFLLWPCVGLVGLAALVFGIVAAIKG